ncbi:MAG: choice-of-anchor J domain-containing protein [Candidatus Krumholzibacteriota bacterium]|nr:choice-of-anchor J domain-containing protein [Candidatus Krumholzibacteriota bacterium]
MSRHRFRSKGFRRLHGHDRRGFTLVELLIGALISSLVIAVAFQVLVGEKRSAEDRRQDINAQQNLRVALDRMTRDVRMAGAGIDDFNNQPRVVDAAPWQIAFNADIASGVGGLAAMNASSQIKLLGGATYSPGDFPGENLGALPRYNGGAETVVLGLDANFDGVIDDTDHYADTQNPADFALYRGVNGLRTDRLAYGLRGPDAYPDGTLPPPLFSYWGMFSGSAVPVLWGDTDGNGSHSQGELAALTAVPVNELGNIVYVDINVSSFTANPIARMAHVHGTVSDPFKYLEHTANNRVRPRNIGVNPANLSACGNPPARPTGVWAQDTPADPGQSITVYFNASADESGGEEDVTHYFIYRREQSGAWGGAIAQVPAAGLGSYSWNNDLHTPDEDDIPVDGENYYYAVTAWDCKPQESSFSNIAGPVSSQPNGSAPPVLTAVFDTPCDEGGEITVEFDQSTDEPGGSVTGYRVYRGPTGGAFLAKTLIGFVNATGTPDYTFLDNITNNVAGAPPQDDVEYWYTVRAVNDTIISVDSNEMGPVICSSGLSAAALESVTDVPNDDGTALQIVWQRSLSETCVPNPVVSYIVQRKGPTDGAFVDVVSIATTGDPGYVVQDSLLIPGQIYAYRVMTTSLTDQQPSNQLTGSPTNNLDLLPPSNVQASPVPCDGTGAIRVTWDRSYHDNGSGDMEYYRVWRRVQGGSIYSEMDMVLATTAPHYSWDDAGGFSPSPPVIGTTYEYVVTSYNQTGGNESGYSNMADCASSSVPGAPYLISAVDTPDDGGSSITLWFYRSQDDGSCMSSVVAYFVYRSLVWGVYGAPPVGEVTANGSSHYTYYDNGSGGGSPPVNGTPYYYMLRAFDGTEMSVNSNQRGPVMALEDAAANVILFQDGFETDLGWTHGGTSDDWQRGDPVAKSQYYGNADPENAYLGDDVYGNDIGNGSWNGRYSSNADSWLRSPAIDCSGAENVRLHFYRWLNVEQPIYDQARVLVSGDGDDGPWIQIWANSAEVTDNSWVEMDFDIHSIADGESDVRILFQLESDSSWEYAGWNIDEVTVTGDQ